MRVLLLVFAATLGCAAEYPQTEMATADYGGDESPATEVAPSDGSTESSTTIPAAIAVQRKIIYTAELNLAVEEFDPIPARVEQLVGQFDAYVARSKISGTPGKPRTGNWSIRVPVSRYQEFLTAARELGEIQSESSDSKDVTAEFYDVDARIRNKQREEERLVKLLEEATGKLQDILEVERELSRVRGEVEQLQGRLRVLKDLTSMTTVELRIDEIKDYVPSSPEAPTYVTRVRRALAGSLQSLLTAAQYVSIFIIAALPWFAVLLLVIFPLVLIVRIRRRRRS